MTNSQVIDYSDPDRNMYGCAPCPKCGGKYRAPYRKLESPTHIRVECDGCGHGEPGVSAEGMELDAEVDHPDYQRPVPFDVRGRKG